MHETVKSIYSWKSVTERAEKVFFDVVQMPKISLIGRIKTGMTLGPIAGIGQVFWMIWISF